MGLFNKPNVNIAAGDWQAEGPTLTNCFEKDVLPEGLLNCLNAHNLTLFHQGPLATEGFLDVSPADVAWKIAKKSWGIHEV
jgi:hypothetical protein